MPDRTLAPLKETPQSPDPTQEELQPFPLEATEEPAFAPNMNRPGSEGGTEG